MRGTYPVLGEVVQSRISCILQDCDDVALEILIVLCVRSQEQRADHLVRLVILRCLACVEVAIWLALLRRGPLVGLDVVGTVHLEDEGFLICDSGQPHL